ncbi:hypothetical protein [Actinoallomurus acaciae]|uniref:ATP/GTP-binding protein n=1 Tax=Actinoallomurus acaciae TaxID=502577 RepID=A0ABV5YAP2_9ACTN
MLTKLSAGISIAILTAGATVALGTTSALACNGPCGGPGAIGVHEPGHSTYNPPAHGPHGKSGKGATAQCPPTVACLTVGNNVPAAAPVRTVDVAFQARDQLELPTPTVHTSPENRTYVALRTGLWLGAGIYARKTVSVGTPDGATTVTAIGDPQSVTWNMGESSVTCHSRGSKDGKACGYTYQRSSAGQPNHRYAISVTVTWYVHWTCAGVCDARAGDWAPNSTMSRTTDTTLAVGEVQTESRPG